MWNKVTVMLAVRGLAVAAILSVGLAAFRLSFVTLRELAVLAGIRPGDAWLFPVIIDITTAIAAVMALAATDPQVRQWFSWVLGIGTVVSIVGNAVHAIVGTDRLPVWACAMVAAVAPIALLVDVHGLILILRAGQQVPLSSTDPVSESVAVPVPVADPGSVLAEPRQLDPLPDPPMVAVSVAVAPPPRPLPVAVAPVLPVLPVAARS
ncbi:DUF2637 domain-containing protein [Nocardia sp. NPDC056100]|uniref:DUF2637 domain-containing protein n=1 Tax=Nocardia sp. NPDC056100 TaxID=3345712 RepID=UPI0035DF666F